MEDKDIIKVDEKNLLFIQKTTEAIEELLPKGELPKDIKAVLLKMKFDEARDKSFSKLIAQFPNHIKSIGSIIINNAIIGLAYNKDYWITPQSKAPLFQFKAEGYTKLLQTHAKGPYKLALPIQAEVEYEEDEVEICKVKGVVKHKTKSKNMTNKLEDIVGAYAQYTTESGKVILYYLSKAEIDAIMETSYGLTKKEDGKQVPNLNSPWIKWPEKMCRVKAIKGLCQKVKHLGGFNFDEALLDYLSQDEMLIDDKGNPIKPTHKHHVKLPLKKAMELDELCHLNKLNCENVLNTYNITSFLEAHEDDYEEIKQMLQVKQVKATPVDDKQI